MPMEQRLFSAHNRLRPRVTGKQFRQIEATIEQKDNDLFPSEIFMCARKNSRKFVKGFCCKVLNLLSNKVE